MIYAPFIYNKTHHPQKSHMKMNALIATTAMLSPTPIILRLTLAFWDTLLVELEVAMA